MMKRALLLLSIISAVKGDRTYVDDKGVKHTTSVEKPTIVTFAHNAVTLEHYGLDRSQLLGTFGEWANTGSDYDFDNLDAGSSYPADPTPEEMRLLTKVVNLSPSCGAEYCVEFDVERLKLLKPDFLLMHGYRQSPWAVGDLMANITEVMGDNIIYNEISLEGENCTAEGDAWKSCYGKSMIELIDQNFEIAKFLNLDIPSKLNEDMNRLCNSAAKFQTHMKTAHSKGLRTMAAYLTTATSYFAVPHHDSVLRMLEELGMPIMHVGACTNKTVCPHNYFWEYIPIAEYFPDCAENAISKDCNEKPLYPVDFWLYDHRTTLQVTNEDFGIGYPDRAILKKQMDYWPIGGRLITPHHAANILDQLGPSLAAAERLHPKTACTSADVTDVNHRTSGLPGAAYACYDDAEYHNSKYFTQCDRFSKTPISTTSMPPSTASSSTPLVYPGKPNVTSGSFHSSLVSTMGTMCLLSVSYFVLW